MTENAEPKGELIVHPRTGEAFDLSTASPGQLVEAVGLLRADELRFANWRRAAEDELIARLDAEGRRLTVVQLPGARGFREIAIKANQESVWDADELDSVLADLVGRGLLAPRMVAGIVTRSVKVDRTRANKLLERFALHTPEWKAIAGCRTWRQKGRRSITVAEVPNLEDVTRGRNVDVS
jgi:hypothetical protein